MFVHVLLLITVIASMLGIVWQNLPYRSLVNDQLLYSYDYIIGKSLIIYSYDVNIFISFMSHSMSIQQDFELKNDIKFMKSLQSECVVMPWN